ncbi:MAG TPA: hypothetical protein VMY35_11205, partial [Phycisphaerae bacterium]|nr:hypothetical protein [Phycisphaerae bacterium]
MSNTLEFANEFTCPKCCERLRVDRAVPPEPVPVPDTPRIRDFTFWDLTRPAEVRLDMPVVWQGGWRDYDNAKQAIKAKSFGFAYQAYVSNEDALAFPWDNIPSIMAASDGPWTREQMLALYAQVPAEVMCAFPEHLADIQSQEFIQAWRRCNPFDPRAETWAYRSPYALFGEVIRAKFYGRIVKAGPQLFNSYTGAPENPAMVDFAIRGAFREGADGIVCWGESRCTKDTIPWDIINAAFDEPRIVRQPVWGVYEPFLAIDDAAMWELLIRFFDFELFDDLADVGNYKHVLIPVLHENYWVDWETRWYRDK